MSNISFTSQDGLDNLFWGSLLVTIGTVLAILGIVHWAFSVFAGIIALIGWFLNLMGISALRRDYRARVQRREASPPPPPPSDSKPTCPTCGGPLTYVDQYQRWYCPVDQKYV